MSTAEVHEISEVDDALRATLLACWVDVTNAGGAVGFVPPVTADDIAPVLDKLLDHVRSGRDVLCVLTVDGDLAGFAVLVRSESHLRQHWASVLRVQVHPRHQRAGLGRALIEGVHAIARRHGFEFTFLNVRGGTGIEKFYERFGYRQVGRMPRALLLGDDDYRDEISMVRPM